MTDIVKFNPRRKELLKRWLRFELQRTLDARKSLEVKWRGWLELYRAPKPRSDGWFASFPFEGAANYTFPLGSMTVDPIKAKYLQSLHATENLWTVKPLNERWVDAAKPLQDYLQYIDFAFLNMWNVNQRVLNETLKLGTGVYKTGWRFEQYRTTGYNAALERTQLIRELNQPTVDHVLLDNFLIPPEAVEIDVDMQGGAQWVAERFRTRPGRLRQWAEAQEPFLPNFDKDALKRVLAFSEQAPTEMEQKLGELDEFDREVRMWENPIELYECWVRFDADGDGTEEDFVVIFHYATMEILRAIYVPFAHGKRPYHVTRFLRGDSFYGIGLCERSDMWQTMLSDVLNNEMNRALLSNAPMIAYREGANVLPNEPIFPLKMWPMAAPKDDIVPFWLTGGNPSDLKALFGLMHESARQATGVTELQFGALSSVPSRTPATTVQSLLQETNTRIDLSLKDARIGGLSRIGLQILQNIQQQVGNTRNNPDGSKFVELAAMVLGEPEGQFVAQTLVLPYEDIAQGIAVELTATSAQNNKELTKQNFLALMQVLGQRAPLILQLATTAQQAAQTPVGAVAASMLQAEHELISRLLEQFDIRNPEDIVPNVSALLQQTLAPQAGGFGGAVQPQFGGSPGPQGPAGFPGMGGF